MKTICIYHSRDLDGWMSGAIVKMKFPDVELIGWDYGNAIPDINEDSHVVMADISFPPDYMFDLDMRQSSLTWIDHHVSAIKGMADFYKQQKCVHDTLGLRDSRYAACELTWKYFYPNEPMPEIIRLLGRYDCFGHKGTAEEQKVLEFQYGARQAILNVDDAYKYLLIARGRGDWGFDDEVCAGIYEQGKAIYKYVCSEAQGIYKRVFTIVLDGYKFACVNQERFNPINFGIDYHLDGYDGFACFWYANGLFNYSLYNDNGNVDCSVIAKNRGGGGHKGASGFRSGNLIL